MKWKNEKRIANNYQLQIVPVCLIFHIESYFWYTFRLADKPLDGSGSNSHSRMKNRH